MNLTNKLLILLALTGIASADTVCQTNECKQTADLILNSIDHTADPCDDFYQYSCGKWIENHPLTAANANTGAGHFQELTLAMLQNLERILGSSSIATDQKYIDPLINFYKGCVNYNIRDTNEKKDLDRIRSMIKQVGGWPIIDDNWNEATYDVENSIAEFNKLLMSRVIFSVDVIKDFRNNSQSIVAITNPLGPRNIVDGIYRIPEQDKNDVRTGVKDFSDDYFAENNIQALADILKGSAVDGIKFADDMRHTQTLDNELRLIYVPINNFNHTFTYYDTYKIKASELSQYKGINLRKIIDGVLKAEGLKISDNDMVLADKEYLTGVSKIMGTVTKRAIANMIGVNTAVIFSRFTSSRIMALAGIPSVQVLPQVCVSYSQQLIPDLLGRYYMDKLFAKDAIDDMKDFIASLKEAFHQLLDENKWLDTTTKQNAIKKLNAIAEHIAFPEYTTNNTQLMDYDKKYETFSENDFFGTMLTALGHQRSLNTRSLVDKPLPGHWPGGAFATMINAFYNPFYNGIFFPAGIAQFPFYQHTRPKTVNLGSIGMVISHELTHAFDNMGSLFDESGNLHNWFGPTSKTVFNQKAECFVEQYNKFRYEIGTQTIAINGLRTLGENIADNGGVRIAYRALELYKSKNAGKLTKLPGTLANLTDEKLFFLSFANLWCSNRPAAAIANQIALDPHSIEDARVIGTLSNFPEFAKAFNCPAGSEMNPTNRCVLWG